MTDDAESAKSLPYQAGTTLEPLSGKVVPDPPTHPERVWGSEPATAQNQPDHIAVLNELRGLVESVVRLSIPSTRGAWERRAESLRWAIRRLTAFPVDAETRNDR